MKKIKKAYFSNHFDLLYEHLKQNLFMQRSFSLRRIIVVPNLYVKNEVMQRLAKDRQFQIASFFQFVEIGRLKNFLFDFLLKEDKKFPNYLEMHLSIETAIKQLFSAHLEKEEDISSLFHYLHVSKEDLSFSKERLNTLCDLLTIYFFSYGLVGKKKYQGWQERIWQQIFEKTWTYPLKEFLSISRYKIHLDMEIHFFGVFFLPKIFFSALEKMSFPMYHYLVSPCLYFWEDTVSNKEKKALTKYWRKKGKSLEIDNYLRDTNFLLANLGKIQRKYLSILDQVDVEVMEHYQEKNGWLEKTSWPKISLLEAIKNDLLYMRNPESSGLFQISQETLSLQIHEVSSKIREVEAVYDYLCRLLKKEPISFSEISILAPDIHSYLPYIHMIFGSSLPYKIFEINAGKQSFFYQGILQLFSLAFHRFDKDEVWELFENPAFCNRQQWKQKEIDTLKKWVEEANIRWGIDANHRKKILQGQEQILDLSIKTWDYGIQRMLYSFIVAFHDFDSLNYEVPPLRSVSFSDIDLFERLVQTFEEIKKDIERLQCKAGFSLKEWAEILLEIVNKNFSIGEDLYEEIAYKNFNDFIEKLYVAHLNFEDKQFDFSTIFHHLKKAMEKKNASFHASSVEAVSFCSLKKALVPSKVVCLLGMDEDFPQKDFSSSLNLVESKEYDPVKSDEDRYLFLQAILSCQKYLYISYVGTKEKASSSLVKHLLYYIDSAYERKKASNIVIKHPCLSFDSKYFLPKDKQWISFSKRNYLGAKKYAASFSVEKKNFFEVQEKNISLPDVVEVRDLRFLARNPMKFYVQQILGIFLKEKEDQELQDITLSFLEKYLLRQASLLGSSSEVFQSFEKQGRFPEGRMKKIVQKEVQKEIELLEQHLNHWNVDKKDFLELKLKMSAREWKKINDHQIEAPPLEVQTKDKKIQIIGTIENISSHGFFSHTEASLEQMLKIWPEFLIFSAVRKKNSLFDSSLFFTKAAKKIHVAHLDAEKALQNYIKYYERCLSTLSPMIKKWAEAILLKEKTMFQKVVNKSLQEKKVVEDPYFQWLFSYLEPEISSKAIFEDWADFLRTTFQPLLTLWKSNDKKFPVSS